MPISKNTIIKNMFEIVITTYDKRLYIFNQNGFRNLIYYLYLLQNRCSTNHN